MTGVGAFANLINMVGVGTNYGLQVVCDIFLANNTFNGWEEAIVKYLLKMAY